MRVAVFGGSFDPLHVVHEQVARDAAKEFDLVLVVPAYKHALKPKGYVASFNVRMAMATAAFMDDPNIEVSSMAHDLWEQGASTYSYHLLSLLQARRPKDEFTLLVGADILAEAHKWHRWDDILVDFGVLSVGREGIADEHQPRRATIHPNVSATDIRRRLAAGQSVEGLVSTAVKDFLIMYQGVAA